jgi:hypothetical protein
MPRLVYPICGALRTWLTNSSNLFAPLVRLANRYAFRQRFMNHVRSHSQSWVFSFAVCPNAVVASHSRSAALICTMEEFVRPRIELLSPRRLLHFGSGKRMPKTKCLARWLFAVRGIQRVANWNADPIPGRAASFSWLQ